MCTEIVQDALVKPYDVTVKLLVAAHFLISAAKLLTLDGMRPDPNQRNKGTASVIGGQAVISGHEDNLGYGQ